MLYHVYAHLQHAAPSSTPAARSSVATAVHHFNSHSQSLFKTCSSIALQQLTTLQANFHKSHTTSHVCSWHLCKPHKSYTCCLVSDVMRITGWCQQLQKGEQTKVQSPKRPHPRLLGKSPLTFVSGCWQRNPNAAWIVSKLLSYYSGLPVLYHSSLSNP